MKNKNYWDEYYSSKSNLTHLNKESSFAQFVFDFLKKQNLNSKNHRLLDVACGNGRDSFYFADCGLNVDCIDLSSNIVSDKLSFHKTNLFEFNFQNFDSIYLRFVIHSLTEHELNALMLKIEKECKENCYIFIETRSSKEFNHEEKLETFFNSSEGKAHYRILYSLNYLKSKFEEKMKLIYEIESKGLAMHKEENPWIIRIVLKK
jgi:tellurite methyltransferase